METETTQAEVDAFLDALRLSGTINMFGAPSVLRDAFGFDKATSEAMFWEWANNFEKER